MRRRRRILIALFAAYGIALVASHVWRAVSVPSSGGTPGVVDKDTVTIQGSAGSGEIRLAFREHCCRDDGAQRPVLLMLHGSPGSSRDFELLGPVLADRFCVVAPDLPGFGDSTRDVPDYSIVTHAEAAIALIDRLGIESAHVLGFSMGGGVALEMTRLAPGRLRSLTLLSSIGVQEAELLGNYHLNHAVHGAQLAGVWLLHEATPHFGLLDGFILDVPFARNFFDTDQRPLRSILRGLELPVLILHGRDDPLVPLAAALEHHRLVPQSELVLFEASHFMVFRDGETLAEPIVEFLERVEAGGGTRRSEADPERIATAADPADPTLLPRARGVALFVLMNLLALATFVSEDLASIGAGLLVAQGRIGYFAASLACFAGIFVGDVGLYLIGRILGRPWMGRLPFRWWVSEHALARSRAWFDRRGPSIVFASRFLPGTRVATYVAAGIVATSLWRFSLYLALAAAAWVPLLVGAAYLVGVRLFDYFEAFQRWAIPGTVALAILAWILVRLIGSLVTHTGRRLWVGRFVRLRHWEFWPAWVVYAPVVVRVVVLGLRYRGLTVFTAANPAIPAGGFVGESKSAVLDGIAAEWVAPYRRIEPGPGAASEVAAFMTGAGLEFPVVLKPDVGERGRGVTIVSCGEGLAAGAGAFETPFLVQELIPGPELGIFYVRQPADQESAGRGEIFSITEKRLPEVVGDGERTVERLVLDDPRAVAMARTYLHRLTGPVDRVPAAGEVVRLTDVGTHCLGSVFLDGKYLETEALAQAVDRIARSFEGFYFGRFDLKAPSLEAFRRGEDLVVIELNGVTSEATHIYDRRISLGTAWKALFRQWDLAFEIGRMNRERGVAPATVGEVISRIRKHVL